MMQQEQHQQHARRREKERDRERQGEKRFLCALQNAKKPERNEDETEVVVEEAVLAGTYKKVVGTYPHCFVVAPELLIPRKACTLRPNARWDCRLIVQNTHPPTIAGTSVHDAIDYCRRSVERPPNPLIHVSYLCTIFFAPPQNQ